jgi:hypothetical protein
MADDELAAVRSIRRDISHECGGDLDRVFDYYQDVQKRIKESGRYEFVNQPIRSVTPMGKSAT